nr:heterogeneous nuclear ribonucleoprotein 1-like [Tanacetum cinerariifolium]
MGSGSLMFGDGLIGRRKRKKHAMKYAYRHRPVLKDERDKVELFGICSRGFVEMDEVDGDKFVENEFKHNKIVETHVGVDGDCEEDEDGKGHESESVGVVNDDIDLHNHGEECIENKEGSVKEGENGLETVIDKLMSKNGESLSPDKKLDACLGSHIGVELTEFSRTGVHLFGKCHDLRLIRKQEWVNEGGDIDIDIRGLNVNGFLAYIRDDIGSLTHGNGVKGRKREQLTSRLGSDVRRSSGGEVNYKTKKIFVGGLPATLTEEQLQQYFESYGVDGKKIIGLLRKLCKKQAQVVANDPLLMLIKGEVISDWYWNNVCEESPLDVDLLNMVKPFADSAIKD